MIKKYLEFICIDLLKAKVLKVGDKNLNFSQITKLNKNKT